MTGNRLLDALSPAACEAILAVAQPVDLPRRTSVFETTHSLTHVHFLTAGVASVVISMAEGGSAEVGMVGSEGIVGSTALLGPGAMQADGFMQIEGKGLRVPIQGMRRIFDDNAEVRNRILQFLQTQMSITSQISACNKLHEAEERLARWLLMAADRAGTEVLNLTQEFLAEMLGSQRTTVALVAGTLQRAGLIDYSRGRVRIQDHAGLTAAACECYGVTHKLMQNLYQA